MKSVKKMMEAERIKAMKNPGKENKARRKAERGATFTGFRPCVMASKKQYNRAAQKKALRREAY